MTTPDYFTLLFYLAGLAVISVVATRRTTSQAEMFAAGRNSPWWASGLSGFMTMFSANTFVVWGGIAYQWGLVAVLINTTYGIAALLVGYFVAGYWNKLGVATPAEFVRLRFGRGGLHFFTWTILLKRIMGVGASLYALGILLTAIMNFDLTVAIIAFGAIVVIYTMMGGLWAVLMTDVLQFIVLTVVVFVTAFLMLQDFGGWHSFTTAVPETFLNPVAGSYGWLFLLGWTIINFFTIGAEWAFAQRFISVKNPAAAKKSAYLFGVMYLVTPLFWLLPPMLYRGQVADANKEQAYMLAAESVLPPGIMGLMVAALFSATASMVSSQLNVFAGVLTNDFYRAVVNPKATERRLVLMGRFFTILLGALLATMALLVPKMGGAEKLIVSINSLLVVPLFAPTVWGLFSKKIGIREMVIVALTSFGIGLSFRFGFAVNPLITEGHACWGFAQFLSENTKNVEVLVGVILPVVMLCGFEFLKQKRGAETDQGATRVDQWVAAQHAREQESDHESFDPFPARIVIWSLFAMGAWMGLLGLLGAEGRPVILSFAGFIVLLAAALRMAIAKHLRSTAGPPPNDEE